MLDTNKDMLREQPGDELDYTQQTLLHRVVNVLMWGIIGGLLVSAVIIAYSN